MRSPEKLSRNVLLLLAFIFGGLNIWTTAARTAIPLKVSGRVIDKTRLIEKKAGVDDVYLVELDSGRRLQVDEPLFAVLYEGVDLEKQAWKSEIAVDQRAILLEYSADLRGMLICMPMMLALYWAIYWWQRPA